MELFISYSLAAGDAHIASLLSQQAKANGLGVNVSCHWLPGIGKASLNPIKSADIVIAIVSLHSQYELNVQEELTFAASLGKPILALVEQGISLRIDYSDVYFVEFDRYNVAPALHYINSILTTEKKRKSKSKWTIAGGLALLALYLFTKD